MLFSPDQHYRWREAVLLDACLEITLFFSRVNKINESPCSNITATINVTHCSHTRVCFTCLQSKQVSYTNYNTFCMMEDNIIVDTFMETAYSQNSMCQYAALPLYVSEWSYMLAVCSPKYNAACPFTCSQFRLQHIILLKWAGQTLNWEMKCLSNCALPCNYVFINSEISCSYACNAVIK